MTLRNRSQEIENKIKKRMKFILKNLEEGRSVYMIALDLDMSESSLRKYLKKMGVILKDMRYKNNGNG